MDKQLTYFDQILFHLSKLPEEEALKLDILKRCIDWLDGGGSENDPYIKRFLFNLDNFTIVNPVRKGKKPETKKRLRNTTPIRRTRKNTRSSIAENA